MLEGQRGHAFALGVELEGLSLAYVVLRPLQLNAGQVSQHLVGLDTGETSFNQLVTFRFLPFPYVRRFLDVLPIDAFELHVFKVVDYVNAFSFAFPHLCPWFLLACFLCADQAISICSCTGNRPR